MKTGVVDVGGGLRGVYTAGVFDMFHIGHFNLLRQAKEHCEILVVGVNSDVLVRQYKKKTAVISENERRDIVESVRFVDKAVIVSTLDKMDALKKYKFDVLFIGDDWKGSERWVQTENEMNAVGVDVMYLSRTKGISSTELREKLHYIDKV